MKLNFGKFKGKDVLEVPSSYLWWLMNPKIGEDFYPVPKEIMIEASKLYEDKRISENYIEYRLGGLSSNKTEYIIERLGDLSGLTIHTSLEEAIKQLETEYPMIKEEPDSWNGLKESRMVRSTPDPEDDRILIWEILPTGHKKVVWQFSGWHWDAEEFYGLEQGRLFGDERSLYSIAND